MQARSSRGRGFTPAVPSDIINRPGVFIDSRLIVKRLLQGLFYTERYLTNTSLLERHWRRRLLQVGYDSLCKSIDEACAYEGRAGAAVCAQGVLRAVNRGLRNKLAITVTRNDEEDTAQ